MKHLVMGRREWRIRTYILILILTALSLSFSAHAATRDFAVVDLQLLMQDSTASKNARAQIDKLRADHQQKTKGEQGQVERLNQSIAQERINLSEDEYQKRMRAFRQIAANYQSDAQERQDKMDVVLNDALQKIAAEIVKIVDEIKREKKFVLVLTTSSTVGTLTDPDIPNISQEVLRRLNQRMP